VIDALQERFASTQRLLNGLDDIHQRLPVLEARLGTAVAGAAELTLTSSLAPTGEEIGRLDGDLSALLVELDALGQAGRQL
jgi:hypothetical protein